MKSEEFNQVAFARAVDALPTDSLSELREAAASAFAASGFPTRRDEDWRYTNLDPAIGVSNAWLSSDPAVQGHLSADSKNFQQQIDAHWIVVCAGKITDHAADLPAGVTLTTQSANLDASKIDGEEALTLLNTALMHDVISLDVGAGATLAKPIGLLISDHVDQKAEVTMVRVEIRVAENASASFVEAHTSTGAGEHFANTVVDLSLERGATVDYARLQQRGRNHLHTARLTASIADDATLRHCAFDLGGSLAGPNGADLRTVSAELGSSVGS
jgi:Fe-S cluster assembly protein SufD